MIIKRSSLYYKMNLQNNVIVLSFSKFNGQSRPKD